MNSSPTGDARGYQPLTGHGPRLRTDVVDVYVFRRSAPGDSAISFLQLLRAGEPLAGTWHPVMGHIETGETAVDCAFRELGEELGLTPRDPALLGVWALEQVHPFYIAAIDTIVLSPRFAAEVSPGWLPTLNAEHSAHRWVLENEVATAFMWPGQIAACREVLAIARPGSLAADRLRLYEPRPHISEPRLHINEPRP